MNIIREKSQISNENFFIELSKEYADSVVDFNPFLFRINEVILTDYRWVKFNHINNESIPIYNAKKAQPISIEKKSGSKKIGILEYHHFIENLIYDEKLSSFISRYQFLQIINFIKENKILLKIGGMVSRSRPHIRKFSAKVKEYKISLDVQYDTRNGDIFIKLGSLGEGTFKIVKKRLLLSESISMQAIAKQEIKVRNAEITSREIYMLNMAKGLPHVISLLESNTYYSEKKRKKMQCTIYPHYNLGELHKHLKSDQISYMEKLQITIEILKGIIELHKKGIIHRDIKPENIFLHKTTENGKEVIHAFIADFGLSCLNNNDPLKHTAWGSRLYMPPAILEGKQFCNFEMDDWALGIVISEFFTGTSVLHEAKDQEELIDLSKNLGNILLNPQPKEYYSIQYVSWKLMQPEINKRMTAKEALCIVERILEEKIIEKILEEKKADST